MVHNLIPTMSIYLTYICVYSSVSPSTIRLTLSLYLSNLSMSVCLSVCLDSYLNVLSVCLLAYLFVYLPNLSRVNSAMTHVRCLHHSKVAAFGFLGLNSISRSRLGPLPCRFYFMLPILKCAWYNK